MEQPVVGFLERRSNCRQTPEGKRHADRVASSERKIFNYLASFSFESPSKSLRNGGFSCPSVPWGKEWDH